MRRHFTLFFFASLALIAGATLMWPSVQPVQQLDAVRQIHGLISAQVMQLAMVVLLLFMIVGLMLSAIFEKRTSSFEGWDTSAPKASLARSLAESLLLFRRLRLIPAPSTHVHKT
jgi:hypothetical protein